MVTMTATDFARNLSRVLDRLEHGGEEVTVVRNHRAVARLSPGAPGMTAREAFSDLEGLLSEAEGAAWLDDCKGADRPLSEELLDPWA
jgi:antitoxin (DNA-binding transcriptional repressor) of toxin-antitoxin stability system